MKGWAGFAGALCACVIVAGGGTALAAPACMVFPKDPQVVVALIDAGINPYNIAFRDASPLGQKYPGDYIPNYPRGVPALHISLNAPSYAEAMKRDAAIWAGVKQGQLYWIPGTRIVGAMTLAPGGASCPIVPVPPANTVNGTCTDHPIVDDHGHGTMTASRAAGAGHSLAPTARIVEIEGLGGDGVRWAADQGWIDVQSNSWVELVPPVVNQNLPSSINGTSSSIAFAHAAGRMMVIAASGNGAAYSQGLAPTPTYVLSTAAPGVIVVGGHDNGRTTLWAGAPAHIVADAYGGWAAIHDSMTDVRPDPIACCTSAAAPYAAGEAAAIILEARRILGDSSTGYSGPAGDPSTRIVARGRAGQVAKGPLAKGYLTLNDVRALVLHTAQARPSEGRDDGLLQAVASGDPTYVTSFGVGANPFCQLCTTTPVPWVNIPQNAPAYPLIGYGAVNEFSLADAAKVLRGETDSPDRSAEDSFFATDQTVRSVVFTPGDDAPSSPAPLPYKAGPAGMCLVVDGPGPVPRPPNTAGALNPRVDTVALLLFALLVPARRLRQRRDGVRRDRAGR